MTGYGWSYCPERTWKRQTSTQKWTLKRQTLSRVSHPLPSPWHLFRGNKFQGTLWKLPALPPPPPPLQGWRCLPGVPSTPQVSSELTGCRGESCSTSGSEFHRALGAPRCKDAISLRAGFSSGWWPPRLSRRWLFSLCWAAPRHYRAGRSFPALAAWFACWCDNLLSARCVCFPPPLFFFCLFMWIIVTMSQPC